MRIRFKNSQRGVSTIELALTLPVCAACLVGLMALGNALQEHQIYIDSVKDAARETAKASYDSCSNLEVIAKQAAKTYLLETDLDEYAIDAALETKHYSKKMSLGGGQRTQMNFIKVKLDRSRAVGKLEILDRIFNLKGIETHAIYLLSQDCSAGASL